MRTRAGPTRQGQHRRRPVPPYPASAAVSAFRQIMVMPQVTPPAGGVVCNVNAEEYPVAPRAVRRGTVFVDTG